MLILLPPSEGKTAPAEGAPVDLAALAYAGQLGATRERLLTGVERLANGRPRRALEALGLSTGQLGEVERDKDLRNAPAAPAAEVYTGVLFQHLGLASLDGPARARAAEQVLVASALWGVVRLEDRIPAYRLSMGAKLPRATKGLAATWRPALAKALPDEPGDLVLDCRSGAYAAAWTPRHATRVDLKASTADGRPISHMAKAVRGTVARRVLTAGRAPATPDEVADLARGDDVKDVRVHAPDRPGGAWAVEVVALE